MAERGRDEDLQERRRRQSAASRAFSETLRERLAASRQGLRGLLDRGKEEIPHEGPEGDES